MAKSYSEKLKDPRWQKLRLKVFDRDKWQCKSCHNSEATLHVHHQYYEGVNPWDTPIEGLITLCESCHKWEEEFKTAGSEFIKALKSVGFLNSDFRVDESGVLLKALSDLCKILGNTGVESFLMLLSSNPDLISDVIRKSKNRPVLIQSDNLF